MATLLHDILPYDLFKQMLDGGYVRSQAHPQYPELVVLNYTEAAQFDRVWNAATNVCRGLIVACGPNGLDGDAVVWARPFSKFHNLNTEYVPETMEANLPGGVPLVTEKLDGSMGTLYQWDGQLWIATRGSFDSDQARWATAWARKNVNYRLYPADSTPVFEIIYQQNRIVVDYDFEGVVLLSIIDNATGYEYPRDSVEMFAAMHGFSVVPKFDKSLAQCAAENNPNEEGYVLTYTKWDGHGAPVPPTKVKVKFAAYVRLHRILTGLNPKSVWEMLSLKQDGAIAVLLSDEQMPETFKTWFSGWVTQLRFRYAEIETEAKAVFVGKPGGTRKDDALYFTKTAKPLTGILFKMLDGKPHDEVIWDMIKPKATDTFKKDGE
jgi:RNA ligase